MYQHDYTPTTARTGPARCASVARSKHKGGTFTGLTWRATSNASVVWTMTKATRSPGHLCVPCEKAL